MSGLRLYTFWRSGAAHRVRIGLALKGLGYEAVPVNLAQKAQHEPAFRARNPQALTPALELPDGALLTQSLAILEWLEEAHPAPPLLPANPFDRAQARAMAQVVACDIHPLNNQRVLAALRERHGQDEAAVAGWCLHWVSLGLGALEELLARSPWRDAGPWAHGAAPGLADCCIAPQLYAAFSRYGVDLAPTPRLAALAAAADAHPAFQAAHPLTQPDAPA